MPWLKFIRTGTKFTICVSILFVWSQHRMINIHKLCRQKHFKGSIWGSWGYFCIRLQSYRYRNPVIKTNFFICVSILIVWPSQHRMINIDKLHWQKYFRSLLMGLWGISQYKCVVLKLQAITGHCADEQVNSYTWEPVASFTKMV